MTIYNRPRAEVFAENAPPSEIQPFQAWLRGLGIAFDETNGFPEMTGLNGLFNALNQYIKYLEQNGFAEWSADLEYPIGAGVRLGAVWYRAKTQNTNKPPATSQNDWAVFLNAADTTYQSPLSQVSGQVRVAAATASQPGVTRYATSTEVVNRSNVSAAVRPSDVPALNNTLTSTSTTQALTAAQGRALNMQMLGVGQTWQNVTASRSRGVAYTNNTGKPIQLSIAVWDSVGYAGVTLMIGGVVALRLADISGSDAGYQQITAIVPNGQSYRLDTANALSHWAELR